jgi:hypothetical protein
MNEIRNALKYLEKGIHGLVVMTMELENIFQCIFDGRVPPSWLKVNSDLMRLQVSRSRERNSWSGGDDHGVRKYILVYI